MKIVHVAFNAEAPIGDSHRADNNRRRRSSGNPLFVHTHAQCYAVLTGPL